MVNAGSVGPQGHQAGLPPVGRYYFSKHRLPGDERDPGEEGLFQTGLEKKEQNKTLRLQGGKWSAAADSLEPEGRELETHAANGAGKAAPICSMASGQA